MTHEDIDRLERDGKLKEARELASLQADDAHDAAQEATLRARVCELALYTQGAETALPLAEAACKAATIAGSARALGAAHTARARVLLRVHTDTALDDTDEALAQVPDDAPRDIVALRHMLAGIVHARRGHPRDALASFDSGYTMARGAPSVRAQVLLTWAVQLRNWGLFEQAQRKAQRSLDIKLQLNDHYGAAMCYGTLAFIYQRQGLYEQERDALVADMRTCERIGSAGDLPGLHGRLAGALVGLGNYSGAWSAAQRAISSENQRLSISDATVDNATRVHAYAWREQARVCLAQDRIDDGLVLVRQASTTFERVSDGYGTALCLLTEAELHLASATDSAEHRALAALAKAQPVFVRLGALPEAIETVLIETQFQTRRGDGDDAARRIINQVLPALTQAGLAASPLAHRALELADRASSVLTRERTVTRAAMLRSLSAMVMEQRDHQASVVATHSPDQSSALRFAHAAVDVGAIVMWPDSTSAVAVIAGENQQQRSAILQQSLGGTPTTAQGPIDIEHLWPTGVRARGEVIEQALEAMRK